MQVEFSWHRRWNSTAVLCCYLLQTILTRSACPVFLARQPCWTLPPLGWVRGYQPRGHLTAMFMPRLLPLPQSPLLQGSLCMSKFLLCLFSPGLPHLLPFYLLNVLSAQVLSPRTCFCIARHLTEKVQKQISSKISIPRRYQKECLRMLNVLKSYSSSNIVFAMWQYLLSEVLQI
jgi:hypothetical protein